MAVSCCSDIVPVPHVRTVQSGPWGGLPSAAAFRSRAAVHPHVDLRHHYEILQASRLRNGDHRILSVDPESCGDCFCLSVNGIETVDLYLPGCRPVLRAVLVPERSEPGETDRIYNGGDQRASADHQPGVRYNEIRCIQLGQHRRDEHPAVRTGQNRVHLRWRRHAGRAAAAKKPVDIHGLLRLLSGLSCTHGRLRNSTDLLCHIPGHLLPSER